MEIHPLGRYHFVICRQGYIGNFVPLNPLSTPYAKRNPSEMVPPPLWDPFGINLLVTTPMRVPGKTRAHVYLHIYTYYTHIYVYYARIYTYYVRIASLHSFSRCIAVTL